MTEQKNDTVAAVRKWAAKILDLCEANIPDTFVHAEESNFVRFRFDRNSGDISMNLLIAAHIYKRSFGEKETLTDYGISFLNLDQITVGRIMSDNGGSDMIYVDDEYRISGVVPADTSLQYVLTLKKG